MSTERFISDIITGDPVFHIETIQNNSQVVDYQREIARLIGIYDRLSIKACHGVGKTWIAARIVLWFLPTYYPSKIITTAPTARMVKQLLWSEIRAGYKNCSVPLGGNILTTEWKIEDDWFALGFSPAKEAGADHDAIATTFQGFHSQHMLFVLDEATGVRKQVYDQLEGMTTGGFFKILAIGNPTSKASQFYLCFHGKKAILWKKKTINCFDSPNLKANNLNNESDLRKELTLLESLDFERQIKRMKSYLQPNGFLVTARWVMERALEWGIDHPLFRSKVLAEFPEEDENALFTLTQVTEAINRESETKPKVSRRCIGVDPARFGGDKTIITVMEDEQVIKIIALKRRRTTYVTGKVIDLVRHLRLNDKTIQGVDKDQDRVNSELILVDGTGLGAGVVDQLVEANKKKIIESRVLECHFGASAADKRDTMTKQNKDKEHYVNFKAKIFSLLSKDLSDNIILPDENDSEVYQDQLPSINYDFDSKGKLEIESKDAYKKRTGRHSPDEADSLALANWGRHVKIPNTTKGPWAYRL
jgi:hypothetical protein